MYAFEKFQKEVVGLLEKASGEKIEEKLISRPPDASFGDLSSTLAFALAPKLKKKPPEIAADVAKKIAIPKNSLVGKVEAKGPYINFFINQEAFSKTVLEEAEDKKYGHSDVGKGKHVLFEYSEPNPNKPLHVGHLRNTLLGMAVSNLLEANGYKVTRANYINDRGVHICKAMLAYEMWGENKKPDRKPDHFVGQYYALFARKSKDDPLLDQKALELLKKWEKGDKQTRELWKKMVGWCYEGFKETYETLGAKFDSWFYESNIYEKGKRIVEEAMAKGVFKKDAEGAVIAPLEKHGLPNKVLIRPDGTTIYVTSDLALAKAKFQEYDPDISIYCVGSEQNTYFQQLFKIIELLGIAPVSKCYHLSYGMVYLPTGKMSSREGTVINADDIIDEVTKLAAEETKKREIVEAKNVEEAAKTVGLAAVKFAMLRIDPKRDIYFEKEKVVSFEGDTGPYLQYAHVRCAGILEKIGKLKTKPDLKLLTKAEERVLVKKIADFPGIVKHCGANYETHTLAHYLIELTQVFSAFYESCPVAKAESESLKAARAELVKATKNVLKIGLNILGIDAPEKM
jgi:arginyl-tRNA synthetase